MSRKTTTMTLSELIAAFRQRTDDVVEPTFWSDLDIIGYLNEAESEAAERALAIYDSVTPAVTQIAIEPARAQYSLHPAILRLADRTIRLASQPRCCLQPMDVGELDRRFACHWQDRRGTPRWFYLRGLDAGVRGAQTLNLVPIPDRADELHLAVYRVPLTPMAKDNDCPELPARMHLRLLNWALYLAYLKEDSEICQPAKAQLYAQMFERDFGYRHDALTQRQQLERRYPVVRMIPF
jgi:hypothetical protein